MNADDFQEQLVSRASLAGIDVSTALAAQLEAYYRLLAHWNARINLTALPLDPISAPAIDRLLVEPLVAAHHIPMETPVWFDLGTGGGSPAIPLKMAKPGARLTMVESRTRKAAFLSEAVRSLGLSDTAVEAERFEVVAANHPLGGSVDLITVRAVRIDPALFGAIRSLLRLRGLVVLFGTSRSDLTLPAGFELAGNPPDMPPPSTHEFAILERTAL